MKRLFVYFGAAAVSFVLAELVVRFLVGFPAYGVSAKVVGIRSSDDRIQNLYLPWSRYWTVEGGNTSHARNNLGLPGLDVQNGTEALYYLVCGSSYVEALQVAPESLATSVLQRRLQQDNPTIQVLNLGHSGHDIYDSYFRAAYFARTFPPARMILVVHEFDMSALWFNRHRHPLSFELPSDFGEETGSPAKRALIMARNASALINLLVEGFRSEGGPASVQAPTPLAAAGTNDSASARRRTDILACLTAYAQRYPGRFLVASIITDSTLSSFVQNACEGNGVPFVRVVVPGDQRFLGGGGHLTATGNVTLGRTIYETLRSIPDTTGAQTHP